MHKGSFASMIGAWLQGRRDRARWFLGRPLRKLALGTLLVATVLLGTFAQIGAFSGPHVLAAGIPPAPAPTDRFDPRSEATSAPRATPTAKPGTQPAGTPQHIYHAGSGSMILGSLTLVPGQATAFTSSDGRFHLEVPAGTVTADEIAAAGGTLKLQIQQVAPASGSSNSGLVTFGTYLVQVVDASGTLVTQPLHHTLAFRLHYGARDSALDLQHAFVVVNDAVPVGVKGAPTHGASPSQGPDTTVTLGPRSRANTTLDATAQTLSSVQPLTGGSASISFNTDAGVASYGKTDPFNVDLSAGALSDSIPLNIPVGPGGLTPPLALSYSSDAVSESHNAQASAPWVGEGWSLSLGAISWSEHNSNATCQSGCGNGWEDTWQLSDPFGTSADLIPPNIQVATYTEDSANSITPSPVTWHTSPETHAKIYSFTPSPAIDGLSPAPPCFRAYLPNGITEEFGCTADSLGYYVQTSGPNQGSYFLSTWNLDLIVDAKGNQIHVTYQSDTETVSGKSYPRDTVLSTVEYDSPGCRQQAMCTGSAWQPLVRINFVAAHAPSRATYGANGCNTATNVRCDNPTDRSGSGGLPAPGVQSDFSLNNIQVLVRSSASTNWSSVTPLRTYQLSYEINGPGLITEAYSASSESVAGYFDLTQVQEVGDDGGSLLPPTKFTYQSNTQYYVDDLYTADTAGGATCGPLFNATACLLWYESYGGNSQYLQTADNGLGLKQTFTWADARTNQHGVNGGGSNNANPLYCQSLSQGAQATYPCSEADDQNWSHIVLTQREGDVVRAASTGNTPVSSITSYTYTLAYPLVAQECSDCVAGMYWGNQNDGDTLDFYNGTFVGFAETDVTMPDGAKALHKYTPTDGYGTYDTSVPCLGFYPHCHAAPWWDTGNAAHGHEAEIDELNTNGVEMGKTLLTYNVTCPPSGVSGSPSWATTVNGNPYTYTWDGNLVAELDHGNPKAACDIQLKTSNVYTYDVPNGQYSNYTLATRSYSYDAYGRVTTTTTTSNDGASSPTQIVGQTLYIQNDTTSATSSGTSGVYLVDFPALSYTSNTTNSGYSVYACTYLQYEHHSYATGSQSWLSLGEVTDSDAYTNCGTSGNSYTPSGLLKTNYVYDSWGNVVASDSPDANAGVTGHTGCTVGSTQYTSCSVVDSTFRTLPVSAANALNQSSSVAYTQSAGGGFGLWPTSTVDANGQTTSFAYDPFGRMTSETLPGEGTGLTTNTRTYTVWCGTLTPTSPQTPCVEVDESQRLDSSHTVTTRSFYDGWGDLIETRTPAPTSGNDLVQYYSYDPEQRQVFASNPYSVTAYTGAPGANAFSTPDTTQVGTQTVYVDRLTTQVKDAYSNATITSSTVVCNAPGTSDSACYEQTLTQDPLNHQDGTLVDALGRTIYTQRYTGNSSGTYAAYAMIKDTYDYNGNVVQVLEPDGTTTASFTFDAVGQLTTASDPDTGSWQYTYDQDGNLTKQVDARGATGTIYVAYDGLDRPIWHSANSNGSSPFATWTYDSTVGGNVGVGRVTSETFASGPNQGVTGNYAFTYDVRGRTTDTSETIAGPGAPSKTYTIDASYDDADRLLTVAYSKAQDVAAERITYTYDNTHAGALSSISSNLSSPTSSIVASIAYTAQGLVQEVDSGYDTLSPTQKMALTLAYDGDLRLYFKRFASYTSGNGLVTPLGQSQATFDAAGNIATMQTTLGATTGGGSAGGTETQAFCYDDLNRLTWAGTQSTGPCGRVGSEGISGAGYTATYTYDALDRVTSASVLNASSAPLATTAQGTFTYNTANASGHLHALSSAGSGSTGYSAAYDVAGNMTCRAMGSQTCTNATPSGQALTYDALGELTTWQNSATNTSESYAYDGEGTRVYQQAVSTVGSTTTTTTITYPFGGAEEITNVAVTGQQSTSTGARYLALPGGILAVRDASGLSYVGSDLLGTPIATYLLDTGATTGIQLRAPFGQSRFAASAPTTGGMHASFGFTGQREDSKAPGSSGLDYFNARSYDPVVGRFTQADSVFGADPLLDAYAYVGGMVENAVDPSGNIPLGGQFLPPGTPPGSTLTLPGVGAGAAAEAEALPEEVAFCVAAALVCVGGAILVGIAAVGIWAWSSSQQQNTPAATPSAPTGPDELTRWSAGLAYQCDELCRQPDFGAVNYTTHTTTTSSKGKETEGDKPGLSGYPSTSTNDAEDPSRNQFGKDNPCVDSALMYRAACIEWNQQLPAKFGGAGGRWTPQAPRPCVAGCLIRGELNGVTFSIDGGSFISTPDSHAEEQNHAFTLGLLGMLGDAGLTGWVAIQTIINYRPCPVSKRGCMVNITSGAWPFSLQAAAGSGITVIPQYYWQKDNGKLVPLG